MDKRGIEALCRKPRLPDPAPGHKAWPYLLRNVTAERPNLVGATDITYLPLTKAFAYLVAIIDGHARKVLTWCLSNCMYTSFCLDALEEALARYGAIFNTDPGPSIHQ